MNVGVMGAGAIGCYVGGRIGALLVAREGVAAEIRGGLRLTSYAGDDVTVQPRVSTRAEELAACDAVIVTVKSKDTAQAGAELARVLRPDAVVVSLQNGVRNADVLREALGARVLAAMVPFNVLRMGAGRFHQGTSGRVAVEDGPGARALVAVLRAGGVKARAVRDIRAIQWGKLLVNLNNAVNALAGVPIKQMIDERDYRVVMAAILDEAVAVLAAAGIRATLEPPVPARLVARVLRAPDALFRVVAPRLIQVDDEARSSMWDDVSRGRPTEIDALNGEIVAVAERAGRDAPVNRAIVELVKGGARDVSARALRERVGV